MTTPIRTTIAFILALTLAPTWSARAQTTEASVDIDVEVDTGVASVATLIDELSDDESDLPEDFEKLSELRNLLLANLPVIDEQIETAWRALNDIVYFENEVDYYTQEVAALTAQLEGIEAVLAQLSDRRGSLQEQSVTLSTAIGKLGNRTDDEAQNERDNLRSQLDVVAAQLAELGTDFKNTEYERISTRNDIRSMNSELSRYQSLLEDSESAEVLRAKIKNLELQRRNYQNLKFNVEATINRLLLPDLARQEFKTTVSIIFACLVGFVILGFYLLAGRDKRVRRTIFSGDTGIQFITLFAIIIAVILFGITGILADKELAAILAAIAGYILGRSSQPVGRNGDPAPRQPEPRQDDAAGGEQPRPA